MEGGYRFRLRFRMARRFSTSAPEFEVALPQLSRPATLRSRDPGRPLNEADWLVVSARGFPDFGSARDNGQRLKDTLLLVGAEQTAGVDVGLDCPTSSFAQFVKDRFKEDNGVMLRDDVFGLDVFEDVEVRVWQASGLAHVSGDHTRFLASLDELGPLSVFMDDRSRTCGRLINDALFPMTSETRLLILMTAIEALWDRPKRSPEMVGLAHQLLRHLASLDADAVSMTEMANRLKGLAVLSIRGTCKGRITALLGAGRADEFESLYQARSAFAHDGKGRSTLQSECDVAQRLAVDVLLAELRDRQCRKAAD